MRLFKNKKGIYEYLFTKGAVIIFVLALVLVFYNLLENMKGSNAPDVASLEAQRIAKIIDDTITYTDVDIPSKIILLKSNLMVGQDIATHDITIRLGPNKDGLAIVNLTSYPYKDVIGLGTFGGKNFEYAKHDDEYICCLPHDCPPGCPACPDSDEETFCSWSDIVQGKSIEVVKRRGHVQDPGDVTKYYYITCVEIHGCSGTIYLRNVITLDIS